MQINTFRAWFNSAVQQGVGAAKRAGVAVGKRIKPGSGKVDASTGIGDDESSFGGGKGHRAWIEVVEEYIKKFRELFEKSTFQRFNRLDSFLRKFLGLPPRTKAKVVNPFMPKTTNYRIPNEPTPEQAEHFRKQVQTGRYRAQTAEKRNIREASTDEVPTHKDDSET